MDRRRFVKNGLAIGMGTMIGWDQIAGAPNPLRKFPKVDTEVHLWDLEWFEYPWLEQQPAFNKSFTLQSYLSESQKSEITKIIFVESGVMPDFSIEEADWAIAWAKDFPILKGVIAQAYMSDSVNFPRFLELLEERPMIKGIRIPFQDALADPLAFIKNMNRLARTDLTLDFSLAPASMMEAANLLRRCPAVPCILGCMGNPDIADKGFRSWSEGMQAIAELPHVHCKISGLLSSVDHNWDLEQIRPYIDFVVEKFGFDRLMYGGDWPFLPEHSSYQDWAKVFDELLKPFSETDQVKMTVGNAERIYRI